MISFIVIGKNEGEQLTKCLGSVKEFAESNKALHEIIYVDSQSIDGSYEYANSLDWVEAYVLEDKCNAAKARNLGASKSKGDILFFVDGDMELKKEVYEEFLGSDGNLHHPIMTGNRLDIFYDNNWKNVGSQKTGPNQDIYQITTGGLFIIVKELWEKVGGMDPNLDCFEDNDLAYRIYTATSIKVYKKAVVLADHHTIRYTNKERFRKIINSDYFLFRGYVYRKHLRNSTILLKLIKSDITLLFFLISIILSLVILNLIPLTLYFMIIGIKLLFISKYEGDISLSARYIHEFKKDLKILKGFINPPIE